MATLVLTLTGADRAGLVSELSTDVAAHGGSWLTSRMARLAGTFAGVVLVEIPDDRVEAILVVNSCARGQATPASDLDMSVLVTPGTLAAEQRNLEAAWLQLRGELPALTALRRLSHFSTVHLGFTDSQFVPEIWDDGGGPDDFELGVGNVVAYSALLWERTSAYQALRTLGTNPPR